MKKKIMLFSVMMGFCAMSAVMTTKNLSGKAWVGIGYLAAKKGVGAGGGLAIGVAGVIDSTVAGMAWGTAFGGPAGTIAGAVVGL